MGSAPGTCWASRVYICIMCSTLLPMYLHIACWSMYENNVNLVALLELWGHAGVPSFL